MGNGDRTARDLERLKAILGSLPEVAVTGQHQQTAFAVRGKKFAWHLVDHHGDGRVALECKAPRSENRALVASDPVRFFTHRGWVGLYLDLGEIDWEEVRELVTEAYLLVTPKRLASQVGGPNGSSFVL